MKYQIQAIVGLLDIEELWLPVNERSADIKHYLQISKKAQYINGLHYFLSLIGFDEKLLEDRKRSGEETTALAYKMILQKLRNLELVTCCEATKFIGTDTKVHQKNTQPRSINLSKFSLNEKGLQVAFKIQEHSDSKQRYVEQRQISNTLQSLLTMIYPHII